MFRDSHFVLFAGRSQHANVEMKNDKTNFVSSIFGEFMGLASIGALLFLLAWTGFRHRRAVGFGKSVCWFLAQSQESLSGS